MGAGAGLCAELVQAVESTDRLEEAHDRAAAILLRAVAALEPGEVPGFVAALARQLIEAREGVTPPHYASPRQGQDAPAPVPGQRAWSLDQDSVTYGFIDGAMVETGRQSSTYLMFAHCWVIVSDAVLGFLARSQVVRREFLGLETPATREEEGHYRAQAACLISAARAKLAAGAAPADWNAVLEWLRALSAVRAYLLTPADAGVLEALLSPELVPGSIWIGPLAPYLRAALRDGEPWAALVAAIGTTEGGAKPGPAFVRRANARIAAIGAEAFVARVAGWLAAHPLDPARPDPDADGIKQLVWMLGMAGAAGALGAFAERCFAKVPNIGARSTKLGNAALHGLALVEPPTAAALELDRLARRVRQPSARKTVAATLSAVARRAGMTEDDLAEISIPDLGLDDGGVVRFTHAAGGATLRLVAGRSVVLGWHDAAAKPTKSAPAGLRAAAPELVKQARERKAALERALSAAVARIEDGYMTGRDWPAPTWQARFLRHGLLGPLCGRLVWQVHRADGTELAVRPKGGVLFDTVGAQVAVSGSDRVSLWHPIAATVEAILAWRRALAAEGIVQPFKQAHREIYRLTDAERTTETYSNRFAGHILRQHQMLELARSRGWTGTLQGGFDNHNNPTRRYPAHGIWVEYESLGIHDSEAALTHAGVSIHAATDQVRFRDAQGPMRLEAVPPRLFSEAMRDVDLLVGVASVGADPAWRDGGPTGLFGAYWLDYARADLTASGETRREVIAALLPRLALAKVATIDGRHLVVRGSRGTYRIHLGSGSVFMEPGGRYLCIVAGRPGPGEAVALPFEGDQTLSLILSKAFLLAEDHAIMDPSILSQLGS